MKKLGFGCMRLPLLNKNANNHGKASDCIGCKECEKACPQHLKITEHLKDVSAMFDATPQFPTRKGK